MGTHALTGDLIMAIAQHASSIALLYPYRSSYWWDHTDITVAMG
jgi:hypothetical protein